MITDRQKEILKIIAEEYIKTAKPVSSNHICKKLKCSSATIRNEMAKLEELISSLESKDISLQESLTLYEEAMKLSKELSKELEDASSKIKMISEDGKEEDFN